MAANTFLELWKKVVICQMKVSVPSPPMLKTKDMELPSYCVSTVSCSNTRRRFSRATLRSKPSYDEWSTPGKNRSEECSTERKRGEQADIGCTLYEISIGRSELCMSQMICKLNDSVEALLSNVDSLTIDFSAEREAARDREVGYV